MPKRRDSTSGKNVSCAEPKKLKLDTGALTDNLDGIPEQPPPPGVDETLPKNVSAIKRGACAFRTEKPNQNAVKDLQETSHSVQQAFELKKTRGASSFNNKPIKIILSSMKKQLNTSPKTPAAGIETNLPVPDESLVRKSTKSRTAHKSMDNENNHTSKIKLNPANNLNNVIPSPSPPPPPSWSNTNDYPVENTYHATTSGYHRNMEHTRHYVTEDKSYVEEVERFLSKINRDKNDYERMKHQYHLEHDDDKHIRKKYDTKSVLEKLERRTRNKSNENNNTRHQDGQEVDKNNKSEHINHRSSSPRTKKYVSREQSNERYHVEEAQSDKYNTTEHTTPSTSLGTTEHISRENRKDKYHEYKIKHHKEKPSTSKQSCYRDQVDVNEYKKSEVFKTKGNSFDNKDKLREYRGETFSKENRNKAKSGSRSSSSNCPEHLRRGGSPHLTRDIVKNKATKKRARSESSSSCESEEKNLPKKAHEKQENKNIKKKEKTNGGTQYHEKDKKKPNNSQKYINRKKSFKIKYLKDMLAKVTQEINELKSENKGRIKAQNPKKESIRTTYNTRIKENVKKSTLKSVIQIKNDSNQTTDLRQKLLRKGLSEHFTKSRGKSHFNNKIVPQENLVVTVNNEEEETETEPKSKEAKAFKSKEKESLKVKKGKKIKFIIKVCDSSESSNSDDNSDENYNNISDGKKKNFWDDLSFLDDFNIDEIAQSLIRNKSESDLSKKSTCTIKETTCIDKETPHTDTTSTHDKKSNDSILTYDLVSVENKNCTTSVDMKNKEKDRILTFDLESDSDNIMDKKSTALAGIKDSILTFVLSDSDDNTDKISVTGKKDIPKFEVNDCEDSDASTVHLDELPETLSSDDDDVEIVELRIKKENNKDGNYNTISQSNRDSVFKTSISTAIIKSEKDHDSQLSQKEIKQEIIDKDKTRVEIGKRCDNIINSDENINKQDTTFSNMKEKTTINIMIPSNTIKVEPNTSEIDPTVKNTSSNTVEKNKDIMIPSNTIKVEPNTSEIDPTVKNTVSNMIEKNKDIMITSNTIKVEPNTSEIDPTVKNTVSNMVEKSKNIMITSNTIKVGPNTSEIDPTVKNTSSNTVEKNKDIMIPSNTIKIEPNTSEIDPTVKNTVSNMVEKNKGIMITSNTIKVEPNTSEIDPTVKNTVSNMVEKNKDIMITSNTIKVGPNTSEIDPTVKNTVSNTEEKNKVIMIPSDTIKVEPNTSEIDLTVKNTVSNTVEKYKDIMIPSNTIKVEPNTSEIDPTVKNTVSNTVEKAIEKKNKGGSFPASISEKKQIIEHNDTEGLVNIISANEIEVEPNTNSVVMTMENKNILLNNEENKQLEKSKKHAQNDFCSINETKRGQRETNTLNKDSSEMCSKTIEDMTINQHNDPTEEIKQPYVNNRMETTVDNGMDSSDSEATDAKSNYSFEVSVSTDLDTNELKNFAFELASTSEINTEAETAVLATEAKLTTIKQKNVDIEEVKTDKHNTIVEPNDDPKISNDPELKPQAKLTTIKQKKYDIEEIKTRIHNNIVDDYLNEDAMTNDKPKTTSNDAPALKPQDPKSVDNHNTDINECTAKEIDPVHVNKPGKQPGKYSSPIRWITQSNTSNTGSPLTPSPDFRPEENIFVLKLEERLSEYCHDRFTIASVIHRGKFSKVLHCKGPMDQDYVIKMIRNNVARTGIEGKLVALQRNIPNENLHFVRYIDGLSACGNWCYLMEYFPKNLNQALEENGGTFHINLVQHLSRQLVAAVITLNSYNIVHSDIKPGHVLLNSVNDRLKLCGFDSAFECQPREVLPNIGTVNYRAPEIILGYSADYKIDVWSTALVMYEMAARRQLFPGSFNNNVLYMHICTLGHVPYDMIMNGKFANKHFVGFNFKKMVKNLGANGPTNFILKTRQEFFKNNILRASIKNKYYNEWSRGIPAIQKAEEMNLIDRFCNLLEDMLMIHPNSRVPIEYVFDKSFFM